MACDRTIRIPTGIPFPSRERGRIFRGIDMTTMKQRAAARRNIKKAIAANRRGGKKHKKSHRSGRSSAGASSSEAVGSAYINGKMGVQVLSPVSDYGLSVIQTEDTLANAAPARKYKIVNP